METKKWVPPQFIRPLSLEMAEKISKKIFNDITTGKTQVKDARTFIVIGTPGSGKSTITGSFVEKQYPSIGKNYVVIDFDTFVEYHPDYLSTKSIKFTDGTRASFGSAIGYIDCVREMAPLMQNIFKKLFSYEYNYIVHTHSMEDFYAFVELSFNRAKVNFIYIYVDLEIAIKRARIRAITTGKFLGLNLKSQDEYIKDLHGKYLFAVPLFRRLSIDFYIINNSADQKIEEYKWVKMPTPDYEKISQHDHEIVESVGINVYEPGFRFY